MEVEKCTKRFKFQHSNERGLSTNSYDRIRNSFNTVGYVLDDSLSLNMEELDDFALHLNTVFETQPQSIVYNRRQPGRTKFRFSLRKNNGKIAISLLLQLKKLLNKPIWLCQSILTGQRSTFKPEKNYWSNKKYMYVGSGNHVVGPNSFQQFPHHDINVPHYPRTCGIGFYLQNVLSISNGPIEIWPATQHLLGSYALRGLPDNRSANQKETGERGRTGEYGKLVDFYEDLTAEVQSKIFLAQRGEVILRDFRTLHRGTEVSSSNFNRTMVELFIRKL